MVYSTLSIGLYASCFDLVCIGLIVFVYPIGQYSLPGAVRRPECSCAELTSCESGDAISDGWSLPMGDCLLSALAATVVVSILFVTGSTYRPSSIDKICDLDDACNDLMFVSMWCDWIAHVWLCVSLCVGTCASCYCSHHFCIESIWACLASSSFFLDS
jgi:hypothetical protein